MKRNPYIELPRKTIFGGKGAAGVPHHIISEIPYHSDKISGFAGLCRVMQLMKPAKRNLLIDRDPQIIKVWKKGIFTTLELTSQNLAILQRNFLDVDIPEFYEHSVFVFLDPPYPEDVILGKLQYDFILTNEQHIQLCRKINEFNCMVAITTYDNDIYRRELAGWRKIQFPSKTRQGIAIETMYMNYPKPNPMQLHDPTWQSDPDYKGEKKWRGREGLERRHLNFLKKLRGMNDVEKSYLFHALRQEFPYLNLPNPEMLFDRKMKHSGCTRKT